MTRNNRKVLEGVVVSDKMDKTVAVLVSWKVRHEKYEKLVEKRKKYYAHDPSNEFQVGQKVKIMECRPLSKLKRWRITK